VSKNGGVFLLPGTESKPRHGDEREDEPLPISAEGAGLRRDRRGDRLHVPFRDADGDLPPRAHVDRLLGLRFGQLLRSTHRGPERSYGASYALHEC